MAKKTNSENFVKISVDKLSESDVREIVGDSFNQMNARQKNILLNPQNLSMWYELNKQDKVTLFRSATELMRKFWEKRRLQLEMLGISIDEINQVLDCLVNWLEKNGKISAPARVVSHCSGIAVKAFKSLGIIQEQNHQITFCHQSYLDYLIAERLLNNMDNDESIITWLGPKEKQTLFRREQLRQALTLLAEESPRRLLGTVKEIISSDNIRFHLKHLILELLGQMEEDSPVVDFIISLLNDEYWRPHLLETVFNGNIYLIRRLISNGILSNWLNSGDDRIINQGLGLLQSISNKMPDGAAEILESFIDKDGDWPNKILRTICWKITDDSDRMFELRLNLIRRGVILNFIDWESLCEKYPLRSLKLIEAILSTKNPEMIKDNYLGYKSPEYEILDTKELVSLYSVAQTYPEETWECLMPYIERLTFPKDVENHWLMWQRNWLDKRSSTIERAAVNLLIRAGEKLAQEKPKKLFKMAEKIHNRDSKIIQSILIEVYSRFPSEFSDVAIRWLIDNLMGLEFGYGYIEERWAPVRRLIERHSPFCCETLFRELENRIICYHETDEREVAKKCLECRRNGYINENIIHYWGMAQYFLLPALAKERVCKKTLDLIDVLDRKFCGYFNRSRVMGGW